MKITTSVAEAAVVQYLLSLTALTDIVGPRIEPMHSDKRNPKPYIVYEQKSRDSSGSINACENAILTRFVYWLHCVADDESTVNSAVSVIENALDPPLAGAFGGQTAKMVYVDDTYHNPEDALRATDDWPFHKTVVLKLTF